MSEPLAKNMVPLQRRTFLALSYSTTDFICHLSISVLLLASYKWLLQEVSGVLAHPSKTVYDTIVLP